MSLMGSALGGALAGAGAGAAQIANAYIDAEIQEQKARALAEIQYANAVKLDQYNLSKPRQNALTAAEAARERVVGAARNETTLAGDIARAGNKELRQAKLDDAAAAHKLQVEQTIADSGNASLLKAMADLANADPSKSADIRLKNAHANEANARARYLKATGSTATKVDGAEKMDEATRIEYQNLFGQVKTELANLSKFESEGVAFDADGKPSKQYELVKKNVDRARRDLLSFQMRNGLLDAADMAKSAVAGETDSAKIGEAITEAYKLGGAAFGDKFYAEVLASGALERNAQAASTTPASRPLMDAAADGAADTKTRQQALAERQLRTAADYADRQRQSGEMAKQAQAAFSKLAPGDRRAASRMRDDPLFEYLTAQQKASVMRTLSGM